MSASLSEIVSTQRQLEERHTNARTIPLIDQLISELESQETALKDHQIDDNTVLARNVRRAISHFQKAIADDQKETHQMLLKHSKAIAKRFKKDLGAATDSKVFAGKEELINNSIALDFVRQGQFDIARDFAKEAQLELDSTLVQKFETMHIILDSLARDDLSQAISWAAANREDLWSRNSTLEFKLHKTRFMRIFRNEHVLQCITYAQKNFAIFAQRHLKEIQELMAAATYHSNIAESPYASLMLDTDQCDELKQSFVAEFTALLRMTPTSPLRTTVESANLALPTLIKLSGFKLTTASEGSGVDLPLPKRLRFHSVFVCPVTKEVGGNAFMLGCGHVIGGEALHSLAKGTQKIKCPYCPAVSEVSESVRLIF